MAEDDKEDKTCGSCRHWRKGPVDPHNIGNQMGECRLQPHILPLSGPHGLLIQTVYLQMPPNFPSCSHHEEEKKLVKLIT